MYKFFEKKLKLNDENLAQKIILTDSNRQKFIDNIEEAKGVYKKYIVEKAEDVEVERYTWNVPEVIMYNEKSKEEKTDKSIMQPFYTKPSQSKPEKDFISLLDKSEESKNIIWWFKNGESEKNYFAVLYNDGTTVRGFYVDFIFQLKNGKIGIFDTKQGSTAKEAKLKAEALAKFIKEQNKKGKNLVGGIVVSQGNSWKYTDSLDYSYDESDLSNWKFLNLNSL